MTLNVDSLGAVLIKQTNGVSNPGTSDIAAGQLYELWYDGQVFRELGGAGTGSGQAVPVGATGNTGPAGPTGPALEDTTSLLDSRSTAELRCFIHRGLQSCLCLTPTSA